MPDDQGNKGRGRWQGFDFGGGAGGQGNRNPWRFTALYVVVAILVLLAVSNLFSHTQQTTQLNNFYSDLRTSQLKSVLIGTESLQWTTKSGQPAT